MNNKGLYMRGIKRYFNKMFKKNDTQDFNTNRTYWHVQQSTEQKVNKKN